MVLVMGRGRLGRSLLLALEQAGVEAAGWSRGEPIPAAAVYWLCVPDAVIPELVKQLPSSGLRLHSAGALGPEVLGEEGAVLHPLMSFPGPDQGIPKLQGVPATLAGEGLARQEAERLGTKLGLRLLPISGDRRRYHAAATIASSHCSSLFLSAAQLLEDLGISPQEARELLLPLAIQSLKAAAESGAAALTGPTVRGDRATEEGHLSTLDPEERALYALLRARILKLREALPKKGKPFASTPAGDSP